MWIFEEMFKKNGFGACDIRTLHTEVVIQKLSPHSAEKLRNRFFHGFWQQRLSTKIWTCKHPPKLLSRWTCCSTRLHNHMITHRQADLQTHSVTDNTISAVTALNKYSWMWHESMMQKVLSLSKVNLEKAAETLGWLVLCTDLIKVKAMMLHEPWIFFLGFHLYSVAHDTKLPLLAFHSIWYAT